MCKKGGFLLAMVLLCGLVFILGEVVVLAQGGSAVEWWVVSGGGGPSTGAGVALNDTLGQPIIGASSGGNVTLGSGYWYGLGYAISTYVITPTAGAGGVITPGVPQMVSYGGSITFTIAANANYHIADVGVDGVSQGALTSYTFNNVTADHTITAVFALDTYTLTIATAGNGAGVVTPTVGAHPYLHGAVVTLMAAANAGSTFVGWSGGISESASQVMITMTANTYVTATFDLMSICTPISGLGLTFAPPAPLVGQIVWFTGTVSAGTLPITYTWNWGDLTGFREGNLSGLSIVATHTFPLTVTRQTYTVTLTVANACPSSAQMQQPVMVTPRELYLPLVLR